MNVAFRRWWDQPKIKSRTRLSARDCLRCCLLSVGRDEFLGDEGFK